jgi:hypothetical protein
VKGIVISAWWWVSGYKTKITHYSNLKIISIEGGSGMKGTVILA